MDLETDKTTIVLTVCYIFSATIILIILTIHVTIAKTVTISIQLIIAIITISIAIPSFLLLLPAYDYYDYS